MLDANDYADPIGGLPPAERCLLPQNWTADVPIEAALSAGKGTMATAVNVRADHGRWIVECPDCGDAQLAAPEDPRFMCVRCANASAGGKWRPVLWPTDHDAIGELLDQRPRDLANWLPGETVKDIAAENALLADAYVLQPVAEDPVRNPFHPEWEGHTHTWPATPDHAGMYACEECGLTVPASLIEGA